MRENVAIAKSGCGLAWVSLALVVGAIVVPSSWLTGPIETGDERSLVLGSYLFRGALVALGAFLLLANRLELPRSETVPSARRSRTETRVLWSVVAVAAGLRMFRLDAPLWFDEIWMLLDSVRTPISDQVRTFASDNNHPLYSVLATACTRVLGESAWTLRLPAATFGVASVAATYVLARDRLGARTALVAAAIIAVSSHEIWFSQNARAYTGLLLFTLLSSHYFLRALQTGARRDWVAHGVTLAVCVMLHLTGVFVAVGQVVVWLVAVFRHRVSAPNTGVRAGALGLALATLSGFAAYALVLPQVVHFFVFRPGRVAVEAEWTNPLWFFAEMARSFGLAPWQALIALAVGSAIGLVGLRRCWRRSQETVILFAAAGLAVATAMLGLGRNLWPRLFFFLSGFAVILAVESIFALVDELLQRLRTGAEACTVASREVVTGLILALGFAISTPRVFALPKQDYAAARDYIERVRTPDDRVAAVGTMTTHVYHGYFRAGYDDVGTLEDFARSFPPERGGYAVYAFPVFVESRLPQVWRALRARGNEVARFRGSVGGGDVVVLRIRAAE